MKLVLSCFILVIFINHGISQDVTISDPTFLDALLNLGIDDDNDGLIQLDEAELIDSLDLQGVLVTKIQSLEGINAFKNLTFLNCSYQELNSLSLDLPELIELLCNNNNLSSLGLITPKLKVLNCSANDLITLELNTPELKGLHCHKNQLSSLDMIAPELIYLNCTDNQLTQLDFSNLNQLTSLECALNELSALDLLEIPLLNILSCSFNPLVTLDVTNQKELYYFDFGGDRLKYVNMKNDYDIPVMTYNNFNIDGDSLKYICFDPGELEVISQEVNLTNRIVNVFCPDDFESLVKAKGKIEYSANSDCSDKEEIKSDILIKVENNLGESYVHFSNSSEYEVVVQPDVPSNILISGINNGLFNINPESYSVELLETIDSLDFCITPSSSELSNVCISLFSLNDPVPGFEHSYQIDYINLGNVSSNGWIEFDYNDEVMTLQDPLNVWTVTPGKLEMNYLGLEPLENRSLELNFLLNSPMDNPSLESGDFLHVDCLIESIENDTYGLNNYGYLNEEVVNSYDPNDKTCLQGNFVYQDSLSTALQYRIRFENLGTTAATNVVILDTIDVSVYDLNSIQIVDASHSVSMRMSNNVLNFEFVNINLPFEDEANDGYVIYTIKTWDDLEVGTKLENSASIYFDFNWPIHTNIASTEVVEDADGDGFHNLEDCDDTNPNVYPNAIEIPNNQIDEDCDGLDLVSSLFELSNVGIIVYPNPTNNYLHLDIDDGLDYEVVVYDLEGRSLLRSSNSKVLDLQSLNNGIYFLEISDRATGHSIVEKITKW